MSFFLIPNYKGKGVGRVNTRQIMYIAQSQRKIGVQRSSCSVRGQKSKLRYRHSELGVVKVKNKQTTNVHCFIFLVLKNGKEENLIPLFFKSFSLQQVHVRND